MKIKITGRNIEVSKYMNEVVEKKVGKLSKYFKSDSTANVTLKVERNRHICEVTIPLVGGSIIRAEEATGDMYASIDKVIDKLEAQIYKNKTKIEKRLHEGAFKGQSIFEQESAKDDVLTKIRRVVRTKHFPVKPMDLDEAILQMELVSHPFFIFQNSQTGRTNVLYLREDNDLGLIVPSEEDN